MKFLPSSVIKLSCGIFSKLIRCCCFFCAFFWKKSWFEFQCLTIGAFVKRKKNRLGLVFFPSLSFNGKKGHLLWSSCRTTGSFQYKTPSRALQPMACSFLLSFLSCCKVAYARYCWLFSFLMSQWETALWMQPNWNKCTHVWACTRSYTHTTLNTPLLMTYRHWTKYVKSEITAANFTLTMQNLTSF